jgi:hypothetical protein
LAERCCSQLCCFRVALSTRAAVAAPSAGERSGRGCCCCASCFAEVSFTIRAQVSLAIRARSGSRRLARQGASRHPLLHSPRDSKGLGFSDAPLGKNTADRTWAHGCRGLTRRKRGRRARAHGRTG